MPAEIVKPPEMDIEDIVKASKMDVVAIMAPPKILRRGHLPRL